MYKSEAVTRGIRIEVLAQYVPERSEPSEKHWFFAYRIRVSNEGEETRHAPTASAASSDSVVPAT